MAVFSITLGFGPAHILRHSLEAFRATRNASFNYPRFLCYGYYPINEAKNRAAIYALCAEHGITVLDPGKNLGLHHNFNFAMNQIRPGKDDIVIAYDPDSTPVGYGWDLALVRAIQGDTQQKIVWSSLMNPRSEFDLNARGFTERTIDGYIKVRETKTAVTNSICAWSVGWLQSVGMISEPNEWYGGLEASMWDRLGARTWAFLPQWSESDALRDLHDRAYVEYKWSHAHLKNTHSDFRSWLVEKKYDLATGKSGHAEAVDAPLRLP